MARGSRAPEQRFRGGIIPPGGADVPEIGQAFRQTVILLTKRLGFGKSGLEKAIRLQEPSSRYGLLSLLAVFLPDLGIRFGSGLNALNLGRTGLQAGWPGKQSDANHQSNAVRNG